jgi:uncharacterized protein (TIGR03790 family)
MLSSALRLLFAMLAWLPLSAAALNPKSVAVLYNSADPSSVELATFYQKARGIPAANLVGLPLSTNQDISREDYNQTLRDPLRKIFADRGWWHMGKDKEGKVIPTTNTMPVVAIMRGVPLRITPAPPPAGFTPDPKDPLTHRNEAAVDSELLLLGAADAPIQSVASNYFFGSELPLDQAKLPFLLLTSRIDAASIATCQRMIREAIATEKTGLWGRAYIDLANKHSLGDGWMIQIAKACRQNGIPAVVDRFNETLPSHYPLTHAALYYGWYDTHVSGPFLNPKLRLRPGAIALHLHSFSGQQLRDATKNWSAPLLDRGAAATVGNVYEPFLQLTHHFDVLNDRLLRGWTWVEASWASIPVSSWQSITLGDPLYRPFLHLDGSGQQLPRDEEFRALRRAANDPASRAKVVARWAEEQHSGVFAEALALEAMDDGNSQQARKWFVTALENYKNADDQVRQYLHLAAIDRLANQPKAAIELLESGRKRAAGFSSSQALSAWLALLDPTANR